MERLKNADEGHPECGFVYDPSFEARLGHLNFVNKQKKWSYVRFPRHCDD